MFGIKGNLRRTINVSSGSTISFGTRFKLYSTEPGMSIHSGHKNTVDIKSKGNLFKYCLNAFENYINEGYKEFSNVNEYVPVRFITHNDNISNDKINYIASNEIWNRILIGELTLESIIVGGLGKISKPNININHHHHFISKRAYIAQNRIDIGIKV